MKWDKKSWKPVVGYEGLYEVNSDGAIRSVDRQYIDAMGRRVFYKGRILKQFMDVCGYLNVGLTKNHKMKTIKVHRIVAQAFLSNPHCYPQINHKDEDKTNNHVYNLEWCSAKYNSNYGTGKAREVIAFKANGSNCKPIIATTEDGKKEYYRSAREAEKILHYPHTGIANVLKGRAKIGCNRTWEYAEV